MDSIRLRQVVQYIMFTFRFNNLEMVRPERFELPTYWFVASRSIQLSYGRTTVASNETIHRLSGIFVGCNSRSTHIKSILL